MHKFHFVEKISELLDQDLKPGSYLVVWDAANYPSWEYFYRIIAGILRRVRALVCSNEEDDFDRINRTNFNNSKQQHLLPFIYLIPFTRTHFSQPSSLPRLAALFVEKG